MNPEIVAYITEYGYLTIFGIVFLQEIGLPLPVPRELILLFFGYLASAHELNIIAVVILIILADIAGALTLYSVFYRFGGTIMNRFGKVIPNKIINRLVEYVRKRGQKGIYIGRLIPLLHGYIAVAAGLLRIPPKLAVLTLILAAISWSGGYIVIGYLLGSQWEKVLPYIGWQTWLILLACIVVIYPVSIRIISAIRERRHSK